MRRTQKHQPTEIRPRERPPRRLLDKDREREDLEFRRLRDLYRGQPVDNGHDDADFA